ncbi:UNVERIFIED_CONTAM: hypothetical protein ABIC26_002645 [Paenibacillus sp. PvR008]
MRQEEIDLIYKNIGDYKGWTCPFIGSGSVVMKKKGNKEISAYRGLEVSNWVPECWVELKSKIDKIELLHNRR